MTPQNDICPICNYGTSAIYCSWPSDEQIRSGVVPLDSLPAAWWNKMWADTTGRINEARDMVGQLITELNSVLAQAGICPQSACTDQLYQSINLIRQRLASATVAGSVISSADPSKVAVAADGTMTVNCLGNATALTTSAHTVVGAINELKSTYDCCISDINTCTGTLDTSKAPNMHASAATTYGVGNASCYGHVKLSDTYDSILAACEGVAASQKALATAYTCMMACAGAPLGNTVGCALGTASAGVASTAARSDHVHPSHTYDTFIVDAAGSGSWNEGIRINRSSTNGWTSFTLGAACGSSSGCTEAFSLHTYTCCQGRLFVAYQGSAVDSYFAPTGAADGTVYWHGRATSADCATYAYGANSAFIVNPGNATNWSEGIRLNRATNGWSTLTFGGESGSPSGCADTFSMHTYCGYPGRLYIAYQGSSNDSYFAPTGAADGSVYWHGNVCGEASSALCAYSSVCAYSATMAEGVRPRRSYWVACCNPQPGFYCLIYNPNDVDILALIPAWGGSGCHVCAIAAHSYSDATSTADQGLGISLTAAF